MADSLALRAWPKCVIDRMVTGAFIDGGGGGGGQTCRFLLIFPARSCAQAITVSFPSGSCFLRPGLVERNKHKQRDGCRDVEREEANQAAGFRKIYSRAPLTCLSRKAVLVKCDRYPKHTENRAHTAETQQFRNAMRPRR